MVQKPRCVLWAKAHLKWTVSKWISVLWSDESKFDILVGNHLQTWRIIKRKIHQTYLLTPLRPLWDIRLQWALSIAFGPWQHVGSLPMTDSAVPALVTVLRQVVLGLPGFLLPGGVHLKVIFVMRSCSILNTCPSHLRRLCVISLMMLQLPVFLYSSLLEILLGQKNLAYSSEASIMEHFHSPHVCFASSLRTVQQNGLYLAVI